ncbi:MAG TPA: hypothetical protein VMP13_05670 [Acidimicrobiia bacterium]|nr:hypothetical protein [Acidimicrobiia bacterium]
MAPNRPSDSLVLSYLGEENYPRSHPDDDLRPLCRPRRIRGVMAIRMDVERRGLGPCPDCWPEE